MKKKCLVTLSSIVVGVYALNTAVMILSQPQDAGFIASEEQVPHNHHFDTYDAHVVDELHVGPWQGNTVGGLVDMFRPSQSMYLDSTYVEYGNVDSLAAHEYAHISQKNLIASQAGGFPSYVNPAQTASYLYQMVQLDEALAPYAPVLDETKVEGSNRLIPMINLETSADCATELFAWDGHPYDSYKSGDEKCTTEQLAAAYAIYKGEWPTTETIASYVPVVAEMVSERKPAPAKVIGGAKDGLGNLSKEILRGKKAFIDRIKEEQQKLEE